MDQKRNHREILRYFEMPKDERYHPKHIEYRKIQCLEGI